MPESHELQPWEWLNDFVDNQVKGLSGNQVNAALAKFQEACIDRGKK